MFPLLLFIMIHDGIISNGRSYLEDELFELTEMAHTQISKDQNSTNDKANNYQWSVMKVVPNMPVPFNHVVTMTVLIGVPQHNNDE